MGIYKMNSSDAYPKLCPTCQGNSMREYWEPPKPPMPNPAEFKIMASFECSDDKDTWIAVKVNYPGCTNYEGNKILVFQGLSLETIKSVTMLDPHFSDKKGYLSPVARFKPTEHGWQLAMEFCMMMTAD